MGLNAEAHIASPITGTVEPTFNRAMNKGDPRMDVEHETTHYRGWSVALTDGQGIPDHVNAPSEQYDGIACMIRAALAEGQHTDCRGSIKNKAIFFFNWPPYFSIFSHCLQFQKTQKQEKSRITT